MELQPQASGGALCMDARNWDSDAYRDSILKEREIQTRAVFRTVWAPSQNPHPDAIVVASSDGAIASYSISSCISQLSSGFRVSQAGNLLAAEPECFLRAHDGPAYDIKFYGDDEDSLLLSCGDDGRIRGWKWKEIIGSRAPPDSEGNHIQPVLDLVNPQHKGPWGALSPIPENNALAVDIKKGSIYAATGDSSAYCWDVESGKVKMVFKGHLDYLHCIVARNTENQIITGSEDGTARIWDCRSANCIRVINPRKERTAKGSVSCVSCMALDASENWLVCGSGQRLSVWNLPTFECVSRISINAPAQDVLFDDNNQILQVGAEPVVNRFDMKGTLLSQIQSSPKLAFSISLHHSGVAAIGGYGGLVDVISPFGSHLCTFHCK